MVDLKSCLQEQGVIVRELATQLGLARKMVEDWVYREVVPPRHNHKRLDEFIAAECTHHWLIDSTADHAGFTLGQRDGHFIRMDHFSESNSS